MDHDSKDIANRILENLDECHESYYGTQVFSGPSLYFHQRVLEYRNKNTERCIEYLYAMLTSWGMHRMGPKGAKMKRFTTFRDAIIKTLPEINKLTNCSFEDFSDWDIAHRIFIDINIMQTKPILVSNSKILSHLLPNLFAPIDREYTLKYAHRNMPSSHLKQFALFKDIHIHLYYPITCSHQFKIRLVKWSDPKKYPWNTSPLKIVDNLIIGAKKVLSY